MGRVPTIFLNLNSKPATQIRNARPEVPHALHDARLLYDYSMAPLIAKPTKLNLKLGPSPRSHVITFLELGLLLGACFTPWQCGRPSESSEGWAKMKTYQHCPAPGVNA